MSKLRTRNIFYPPTIFYFLLAICYFLFAMPFLALAQEPVRLYLEASQSAVAPESEITIDILLSSKQPINALDIILHYPKDSLIPITFNDSDSMIDLWQNRHWSDNNGIIRISGGLFEPFAGTGGHIARLTFKALLPSNAKVLLDNADVYYADGVGTKAEVSMGALGILVTSDAPFFSVAKIDDTNPPVFESLEYLKNPDGSGGYLAAFKAEDDASGVKAVQIRSTQWLGFDQWRAVESPAKLPSGTWKYQISAADNNGNVFLASLYIFPELFKKIGAVVLLILLVIIFYSIMKKRKGKKHGF